MATALKIHGNNNLILVTKGFEQYLLCSNLFYLSISTELIEIKFYKCPCRI